MTDWLTARNVNDMNQQNVEVAVKLTCLPAMIMPLILAMAVLADTPVS